MEMYFTIIISPGIAQQRPGVKHGKILEITFIDPEEGKAYLSRYNPLWETEAWRTSRQESPLLSQALAGIK